MFCAQHKRDKTVLSKEIERLQRENKGLRDMVYMGKVKEQGKTSHKLPY